MLNPFKVRELMKRSHLEELNSTQNNLQGSAAKIINSTESDSARIEHAVTEGIERIHYKPRKRNDEGTLLLIHGMWHNASCWQKWQQLLAEQGFESIAFSLPGHGLSPEQRTVAECSLGYYLKFLSNEVARLENPILVGHSMGGALLQWYLRYVGEPAKAVFVGSWTSHDILKDSLSSAMKIDPLGTLLGPFLGWRYQFRNSEVVQKWFLSASETDAAQELKESLGPESEIVLMQHRPPKWQPNTVSGCAKLWLAAEADAIIPTEKSTASAKAYGADFVSVDAGHDIMLDKNWQQSGMELINWLKQKSLK